MRTLRSFVVPAALLLLALNSRSAHSQPRVVIGSARTLLDSVALSTASVQVQLDSLAVSTTANAADILTVDSDNLDRDGSEPMTGPLTVLGSATFSGGLSVGETSLADAVFGGTITAVQFIGDGSMLTGVTVVGGAASVPVGTIVPYISTTTIPNSWFYCDGAAKSRTTYPDLFGVVGTAYGEGDGSTTFNLPDFRGEFLRGLDDGTGRDPDASGRAASGAGGGMGDAIGSRQDDALKIHTHTVVANNFATSNSGTNSTQGSGTTPTGAAGTSTETRPRNVYVAYLIKAFADQGSGGGWTDAGSVVRLNTDGDLVAIGASTSTAKLNVDGDLAVGSPATKSTFSALGALTLASGAGIDLSGPTGDITSQSSVTASAFFGDGAGLTGISSGFFIRSGTDLSPLTAGDSLSISTLSASGNISASRHLSLLDGSASVPVFSAISVPTVGMFFNGQAVGFAANGTEVARVDESSMTISGGGGLIASTATFNLLGIGTNSPEGKLHIVSDSDVPLFLAFVGGGAIARFRRANGAIGAETSVSDGDFIGNMQFKGYDGTSYIRGADFGAKVDGNPLSGDIPMRLQFRTAPQSGSISTRMVITSSGVVGIATSAPDESVKLDVSGTAQAVEFVGGGSGLTDFISYTSSFTAEPTTVAVSTFVAVATMTANTLRGGRTLDGSCTLTISNSAGSGRDYTSRVLRDGVDVSGEWVRNVRTGDQGNITIPWSEISSTAGNPIYTLEVFTSNTGGTQTADERICKVREF